MQARMVWKRRMWRRWALAPVAIGLLALVAAACGGGDDPTPTTGAPTATSPAPTATSPLAPGETRVPPTPTPTTPPAPAWIAEFAALEEAAKEEGEVILAVSRAAYRAGAETFSNFYPDIVVEGIVGRNLGARFLNEHEAGVHTVDLNITSSSSQVLQTMLPYQEVRGTEEVITDTRGAIIRPDVFEDENWIGDFDDYWLDIPTRKFQWVTFADAGGSETYINTDFLDPATFSYDDLFKAELKGKWCMQDPSVSGSTNGWLSGIMLTKGTDYLNRLLFDTDVFILPDHRQLAVELMEGNAVFCVSAFMQEFWEQGVGLQVEIYHAGVIPIADEFFGTVKSNCCGSGSGKDGIEGFWSTGTGGPALFTEAPHPNAARLWLNWYGTRDGQFNVIDGPHGWNRLCSGRVDLMDLCERPQPVEGGSYLATDRSDVIFLEDLINVTLRELFGGR